MIPLCTAACQALCQDTGKHDLCSSDSPMVWLSLASLHEQEIKARSWPHGSEGSELGLCSQVCEPSACHVKHMGHFSGFFLVLSRLALGPVLPTSCGHQYCPAPCPCSVHLLLPADLCRQTNWYTFNLCWVSVCCFLSVGKHLSQVVLAAMLPFFCECILLFVDEKLVVSRGYVIN